MARNQTEKLLDRAFFTQRPVECARALIGCVFEWGECSGEIVETEAYDAEDDPACHTFTRPSAREFVENHPAGTSYVYLNYGTHWLFNLLVKGGDRRGFVLFRALDPYTGVDLMRSRRKREKVEELCSGPGKLTQALGIDGSVHGTDFLKGRDGKIISGKQGAETISCPRIGISRGVGFPWRFVKKGVRSISVKPGK